MRLFLEERDKIIEISFFLKKNFLVALFYIISMRITSISVS